MKMELRSLIRELHWIEWQLRTYEDRYGVLSRDFYAAMESGQLEEFDEGEPDTFQDFLKWHGLYKIWLHREQRYRQLLDQQSLSEQLRQSPTAA
jgi:hypothetical protein